jgi:tripartite-type tricarboxylate transporter receptor subunit TctC
MWHSARPDKSRILLAAPDASSRRNLGVRILAVSSTTRSELAPDIPTVAEEGVAGYDFAVPHGPFVPVQTPRPVAQRLRAAVAAATRG